MDFHDGVVDTLDAICERIDSGNSSDLRSLRQACTIPTEAAILLHTKVVDKLIQRCRSLIRDISLSHCLDPGQDFDIKMYNTEILLTIQVIANFSANQGEYSESTWESAASGGFEDMLELARITGKRSALAAVIACIYNCVCGDDEVSSARLRELIKDKSLFSHILLTIPLPMTSLDKEGESKNKLVDADPAVEWLHLLITKVMTRGLLTSAWTLLSARRGLAEGDVWLSEIPQESDISFHKLTHEQVLILLFLISDIFPRLIPFL